MFLSLVDSFLFPVVCICCQQPWSYLCPSCKLLLTIHPEICPYSHKYSSWFRVHLDERSNKDNYLDWCIVAFRYDAIMKRLISTFKYYHRHHLVTFVAWQLALHIRTNQHLQACNHQNTLISRIPSHRWRKYFVKWYNQSEILAYQVWLELWLTCAPLTKKHKHTTAQARLTKEERTTNLLGSFSLSDDHLILKNKTHLLLIDDVTTTGSTLHTLASLIKEQFPHLCIRWVVVARNW